MRAPSFYALNVGSNCFINESCSYISSLLKFRPVAARMKIVMVYLT